MGMLTGSCNVRIFRAGSLIVLVQQLSQYTLHITAIQKTRWQGKNIIDVNTHFPY